MVSLGHYFVRWIDELGNIQIHIEIFPSDSIHEIKCDTIIEALGFEPENIPLIFNEPNLEITQWGTLKINFKNMMTSILGVFAAGDIIRGASLVVWGIRDGRDAAKNIHEFLIKKSVSTNITNEVSLSVR